MQYIINEYLLFFIKIITFFLLLLLLVYSIKNTKKKYISIKNINQENNLLKNKILKNLKKKHNSKKNLFIINFNGDTNATETKKLRKLISIIILIYNKNDEVLINLNSAGGYINNYGLMLTQLKRLKNKNIKITASVDLIAASGGYLLASIADKIIATDFAIIGSIGVIGLVPNFHKLLNKSNIDIEHHTAGEYKSMLNILSKNSITGRTKFIEKLNRTHMLFKTIIKEHRPYLDINKISTGEYWYALDALKLKLIDKIQTSDEYILEKINNFNIYKLNLEEKNIRMSVTHKIISKILKNK